MPESMAFRPIGNCAGAASVPQSSALTASALDETRTTCLASGMDSFAPSIRMGEIAAILNDSATEPRAAGPRAAF